MSRNCQFQIQIKVAVSYWAWNMNDEPLLFAWIWLCLGNFNQSSKRDALHIHHIFTIAKIRSLYGQLLKAKGPLLHVCILIVTETSLEKTFVNAQNDSGQSNPSTKRCITFICSQDVRRWRWMVNVSCDLPGGESPKKA